MKNHICNSHYVNLEDYADEDLMVDYYPVQKPIRPKRTGRKRKQKEDADYSASFHDTKEKVEKYSLRKRSKVYDETPSSNVYDDYDHDFDNFSQFEVHSKPIKKIFTYKRKCPKEASRRKEEEKEEKYESDSSYNDLDAEEHLQFESQKELDRIGQVNNHESGRKEKSDDDESMFEDAEESSSQRNLPPHQTQNGHVFTVDEFIIIESYNKAGENVFQDDSSEDSGDEDNVNLQTYNGLISKPHAKALRQGHDSSRDHTFSKDLKTHTIPTYPAYKTANFAHKKSVEQVNQKQEIKPKIVPQPEPAQIKENSVRLELTEEKDQHRNMKYHQVQEAKPELNVVDQRASQYLPSIK